MSGSHRAAVVGVLLAGAPGRGYSLPEPPGTAQEDPRRQGDDMTIEKIKGECPLCNGSGLVTTDYGSLRRCDCRSPKPRTFTLEQITAALETARLLSILAREERKGETTKAY